ncbi:hydrogenobyrinic acid a,c-diamide synthase (glutamine-hydrolyzing) [bacterium]|nr:hydrogenobyrinic acid a,c-diamide synthase (glutamine-hydrolyzing) [bacterium]MBU1615423.1 hydrogenobyrinic acid a,c-diamide synthase (glutamine-hydrolyzing) [bacterium]
MDSFKAPRIVVSAPHRSSGKTTLSIGLCAALTEAGFTVAPFKKGPDYIDPMWLTDASKRDCCNLDLFMMKETRIKAAFQSGSQGASLSLIEGNMGLYDGIDLHGKGSTSHLARILKSPVILIIDASRMTRGVAALLLGYLQFEPDILISGVVLNKVSNSRHERKLKEAIGHYCGVEVLGALPNLPDVEIKQRHLGLIPTREEERVFDLITSICSRVTEYVNLERIIEIAESAPPLLTFAKKDKENRPLSVRLGVARDAAFTFYYPQNLIALRDAGAELVPFDTLKDKQLPAVNGLYLGGGFPEVFMLKLEKNKDLRQDILRAINNGMPVYAECGGLIYLCRSISWGNQTKEMVGAIPADIRIQEKPKGHGYVILKSKGANRWSCSDQLRGHEFHYSEVVNLSKVDFAYEVVRGQGVDGKHDGIICKNVLAAYTHLHSLGTPHWAENFISFIEDVGFETK